MTTLLKTRRLRHYAWEACLSARAVSALRTLLLDTDVTGSSDCIFSSGSISMLPLNLAPSSRVTRGDWILPSTFPVFEITTFSVPEISPLTMPSIFTTLALMLAFKFPDLPTVTSWFLAVILPLTYPSITRFSSLVICPSIFTPGPIIALTPEYDFDSKLLTSVLATTGLSVFR